MLQVLNALLVLLAAWPLAYRCAFGINVVVADAKLPSLFGHARAVYDGDDSIYIIGGSRWNPVYDRVLKYSLESGLLEALGESPAVTEGNAVIHGEYIYYFGGRDYSAQYLSSVYRYSTRVNEYTIVGDFPGPLVGAALAFDASNQMAYTFGGVDWGAQGIDLIFQFNITTSVASQVARLPEPRSGALAVWVSANGVAYIFGGYSGTIGDGYHDIIKFEPSMNEWTKLPAALPFGVNDYSDCIVYSQEAREAYILTGEGLIKFNVSNEEPVPMEIEGWGMGSFGCAHVPKLGRIYVFGGSGSYYGDSSRWRDDIAYIDLYAESTGPTETTQPWEPTPPPTTSRPPVGCGEGETGLIADPFCCYSFFFCLNGEGTKFDCEEGQQFNPTTSHCEDAAVVRCGIAYDI